MSVRPPAVFVAALPWEAAAVRRGLIPDAADLPAPPSSREGTTRAGDVVRVAACGIGPDRAEASLRGDASAVASVGCAGGLSPGLASGTLVIADRVTGDAGESFDCDVGWREILLAAAHVAGIAVAVGVVHSSRRLLGSVEEKRAAARATGSIAVDMESLALAREAARRAIPFMVARTVLDPAATALEFAPACVDGTGRVRPAGLLGALLRGRTQAVGELVRLARARRRNEEALERLFAALSGRSLGV